MENNEFLQSEEWRKFQEKTGKRTFHVEHEGFSVNIIEHKLPMVGSYFYMPRGFNMEHRAWNPEGEQVPYGASMEHGGLFNELINLAKKEKAGWIRIDLDNSRSLDLIRKNRRIVKAPHNMQPMEVFVIDIAKSEEELLNEMKSKTRYNIKLAEKKGVKVFESQIMNHESGTDYIEKFIKLVKLTAERKGIKFHPEDYYRKMIEAIDSDILSLYVAEYNNKVIAANLVAFYGDTAIYFHGATDDEYRNVMAPYLLQWQAIKDARKRDFKKYDFGGVKTAGNTSWSGITKFKLGFSQNTRPVEFLGSYDIIINPIKYYLYRIIQKVKSII